MRSTRVIAPAKINLTLEVIERLPSGFHRIRSIFVKLPRLADTLTLSIDHEPGDIRISCDSAEVPCDATNLCHRAAARYLATIDAHASVHIHIDKRIPVAAGLGGGSSDAAALLRALNAQFHDRLPQEALARLGSEIGKDIPFFLADADVAFVSGTGETVESLRSLPPLRFLIVNPRIAVPTGEAYAALSRALWFMEDPARVDISARMRSAIEHADVNAIAGALYNDFELIVEPRHPAIKEVRQALRVLGAAGSLMSGSGSTVFGVFTSDATLQAAKAALTRRYPSSMIATA